MQRYVIRALALSGIIACLVGLVTSQVTLSKGWGPGKRSTNDDACKLTAKSTISLCYALVEELRRLIACETRRSSAFGQGMIDPIPAWQMLFNDKR